ncbi:hypothetical protein ACFE04_008412 [Oxalis oulophora]
MARRSSGARSAPRPAARSARSPPPASAQRAPPPAPAQSGGGGGLFGSIGSTIAQGLAFGTGSAIAHRAVESVMGPRTVQHEYVEGAAASTPAPAASNLTGADACGGQSKSFQDCLNAYGDDISKCQFYLDMLSECRRNSSSSLNV